MQQINIHSVDSTVHFPAAKYFVDIVGGFYFETNGFKIKLVQKETGEIVRPVRTKFLIQSIHANKRTKRYLEFEIVSPGIYRIEFTNADKLLVRRSNLFLASLFSKPVSNHKIEIYIYGKP